MPFFLQKIKTIKSFNNKVLKWYANHGRKNLPWQGNNAYHVWVSEIMLQQTQVKKVIDYFHNFIQNFPTLQSLAEAESEKVLSCWSGLGYYNRAKNLHKTAQICYQHHSSTIPNKLNQLLELPGIGRTTAGAILSLASDLPYPILDGNVKRVMSRVFTIRHEKTSQLNAKLWMLASDLMPQKNCREYNQALMDLGSLVCTRSNPDCEKCPLIALCKARKNDQIALYPQPNKKTKQINKTYHLLLAINNNKLLLQKRNSNGIWPQLWFLPMFDSQQELMTSEYIKVNKKSKCINFNIQHLLTHRKLDLQVHCYQNNTIMDENITDKNTIKDCTWKEITQFKQIPHPTALEKIIEYFLAHEDI